MKFSRTIVLNEIVLLLNLPQQKMSGACVVK